MQTAADSKISLIRNIPYAYCTKQFGNRNRHQIQLISFRGHRHFRDDQRPTTDYHKNKNRADRIDSLRVVDDDEVVSVLETIRFDKNATMIILFLHGWTSTPGGKKPTYLASHGHTVVNPALPDENFDEAVRIAQAEYNQHPVDVIVGSSRGGAVAMHIQTSNTPLVLLCPAWKKWGTVSTVRENTTILHSRADDVIPFEQSEELIQNSALPVSALIEVGNDHRLADPEPLMQMLAACERQTNNRTLVDVTVYYLEMLTHTQQSLPCPREGMSILQVPTPSVSYYRSLYDSVGKDYHWRTRKKMSDEDLGRTIRDPSDELHVLHADGSPVGFAELNRRQRDEVELVQFGLIPDFIGQGLGKWFLQWTIDKAWSYQPKRFWLHTCSLDHPAALSIYKKAGLLLFKQEKFQREL